MPRAVRERKRENFYMVSTLDTAMTIPEKSRRLSFGLGQRWGSPEPWRIGRNKALEVPHHF